VPMSSSLRRLTIHLFALVLCLGQWLHAAVPEALQKYADRRLESVQISLLHARDVRQVLIAQGFISELFGLFPDYADNAEHRAELDAFLREAIARNRVELGSGSGVLRCTLPDPALLEAPAITPGVEGEEDLRTFAAYIQAANEARRKGLVPLDHDYWHLDPAQRLHTPEERTPYRVQIRDGLLWCQGVLLDSREQKSTDGLLNFVLAPDLELYAGPLVPGRFHHSTFVAGGTLLAAGEWTVTDGRIGTVTNRSGHYKPGAAVMVRFLRFLHARGVDLAGIKVAMVGSGAVPARQFLIGGDPEVRTLRQILTSGDPGRLRRFVADAPLPLDMAYFLEDGEEETLLHMACDAKVSAEALRLILEREAGVNQADSRGRTPIGILLTHRPVPVAQVEVLLAAHADPGNPHGRAHRDVLLQLLLDGQRELYDSLCRRTGHRVAAGSINALSAAEPENPFHRYLGGNRTDPATVAELLRLGADVNLPIGGPARGFGPLHLAAMNGDLPALRLLLDAPGADVNSLGGLLLRTPLDYAREYRRAEAAAFLLTRGALTAEQLRARDAAPPAP